MTDREIWLFNALKGLVDALDGEFCGGCPSSLLKPWEEAEHAINDVELELGPLPDWATAHNLGREAVQYAQLCTKDGERTGNAVIAEAPNEITNIYYVITDMGSPMRLSGRELGQMFTVGPYIMDERAVMKRKRQNPEVFGEELG